MGWRFVGHGDGRAVRGGRRAAMASSSGRWWRVLLVVRIMNKSRASCCPSWWQSVPLLGRILPDLSPPMPVLSGGFFDAGGGPLCDMDADVERGVVPRDDKYILRPVRLPVRMRCRGPSVRFLYGGLKVGWRKF